MELKDVMPFLLLGLPFITISLCFCYFVIRITIELAAKAVKSLKEQP